MSRFATFDVGDWVRLALYILFILWGLYLILFVRRVAAQLEEESAARGDYDGGSFRPRRFLNDPRAIGTVFVGVAAVLLLRQLAVF